MSEMSNKRYATIFIRLGLLVSVFFAILWGGWHILGHQVPTYTSLKITESTSWALPLNRWWDIPFAFLLVNLYAWVLRFYFKFCLKFVKKDDLIFGLFISFVSGLGAGFGLGLGFGLGVGVSLGVATSFLVTAFAGLTDGLITGLIVIIGISLGVGLIDSLGAGLVVGLGVGLIAGLGALLSSNFWEPIYNWLLAKNIS